MADQMARDNTERRVAVVNSSLSEYPVRPGAHTGCANIDVETAEGNTAVKVIPIASAAATAVITLVVRGPRRLRPTKRSIPSKAANNPTPTAYWGFSSTRLATRTTSLSNSSIKTFRDSSNHALTLGGNVVRRDLGAATMRQISRLLKESIRYSLDHRDDALNYALQYARDMDRGLADRFVGMYVNDWTLDYGPRGREAVRRLLDEGHHAGVIPSARVPSARRAAAASAHRIWSPPG